MTARPPRLILASASPTRADLLRNAGVPFEVVPARMDEEEIKRGLRAAGVDGAALAERLAEAKASSVSDPGDDRLVLGADQVLILGDTVFDKPADRAEAAAQLRRLRGKAHRLVSAACIVCAGNPVWRRTEEAELIMRSFGDRFIEDYLDRIGDAAFGGPGAYRVEGPGIQLFEAIEGAQSTILGLPLLALLDYLRTRSVIAE